MVIVRMWTNSEEGAADVALGEDLDMDQEQQGNAQDIQALVQSPISHPRDLNQSLHLSSHHISTSTT